LDPELHEIRDNDKFYGFKYYQSNGKLTIEEIDDNSTPIQLPEYRVGDARIGSNGLYVGGETLANATANVGRLKSLNLDENVYKNWMSSQSTLTFSWYTSNKTHLIVEVE
jgi:hypothetical protein